MNFYYQLPVQVWSQLRRQLFKTVKEQVCYASGQAGSATATGGMELQAHHAFPQFQPTPLKSKTK